MDPANPRHLFASLYQLRGMPWTHRSGGPHSGLFRSTDAGDTWTNISRHPGLPQGVMGKIGIALSPPIPNRLWAFIEAEDGGLFRSAAAGDTWQKLAGQSNLWWRATGHRRQFLRPRQAHGEYDDGL